MNKKTYEAPKVRKVRLEVRNAVLAICHSSPNLTPRDDPFPNCALNPGCYDIP